MKTIRRSVFETNSSSVHSIVILKENDDKLDPFYDFELTSDGYLVFSEKDLTFNRVPFQFLTSFVDKLRFALASIYSYTNVIENSMDDDVVDVGAAYYFNELVDIVRKYKPEFEGFLLPVRYSIEYIDDNTNADFYGKVIKEEFVADNGGKKIKYSGISKNSEERIPLRLKVEQHITFGYIETDYDILPIFLKKNNISLEEFLINNKYIVVTDGDEYCIWDKFKEMNLVNKNAIESEENHNV